MDGVTLREVVRFVVMLAVSFYLAHAVWNNLIRQRTGNTSYLRPPAGSALCWSSYTLSEEILEAAHQRTQGRCGHLDDVGSRICTIDVT